MQFAKQAVPSERSCVSCKLTCLNDEQLLKAYDMIAVRFCGRETSLNLPQCEKHLSGISVNVLSSLRLMLLMLWQ